MLYSLAQGMVPRGRGFWLRVQQKEVALNRAVQRALDVLSLEKPPPSTTDLWESGASPILASADLVEYEPRGNALLGGVEVALKRDTPRFQSRRRANEAALRALPNPLLRAILAAHCPKRSRKLNGATRTLLEDVTKVHLWRIDYDAIYSEEEHDGRYGPAYQSPRAKELEEIVGDETRTQEERLEASQELAAIVGKRIGDERKKETELFGGLWQAGHGRLRVSREPNYRKCEHGNYIPLCSACAHVPPNDLDKRFLELATEAGYSPERFIAPTRGRPSAEEVHRLDALARAIEILIAEGHKAEAIGQHIGGGRQRVSALRRRLKKTRQKPRRSE